MNYKVTVVAPSFYHYYSGMGPGMLGKTYKPEEIRFDTRHVVQKQGGIFVLGKVNEIDPNQKIVRLESNESISYDVISFNVGSHVPKRIVTDNARDIFTVKPIEKLLDAQSRILELVSEGKPALGVVGGGPAAIEIAGNIWRLARYYGRVMPGITVFASKNIMSGFSEKIREKAVKSLTRRGIDVFEHAHVREIKTKQIILDSGKVYHMDAVFLALGIDPSPIFRKSGLPTGPDGGLLVNKYLQCPDYPEIFGGGDCIYFKEQPLEKVGVYAVRQNPVLFQNLLASLEESSLRPFDPGGDYLLVFNMGDGTGILRKKCIVFGGRPAFIVKDYIDRKFIKKFQAIE